MLGLSDTGRRMSRICRLTVSTTVSDSRRSASTENPSRSCSTRPLMPPLPMRNDSSGLPRYGESKASFSVRLVPSLESNCRASRKLLLPAAFGPKSTVSGSSVTSTSASDLYPLMCTRFSMSGRP